MLIDGTVDIGAADKTIWARPPRGTVGTLVSDDLDDYGVGENSAQITRLLFKYTNTSVVVNHNSKNEAGETAFFDFIDYITAYPDRHISFYSLLHGEWTSSALSATGNTRGSGFCRILFDTTADRAKFQALDTGVRFIVAVADAA